MTKIDKCLVEIEKPTKEIEEMAVDTLTKELISYCNNYGIPASYSDKIHLATSLVNAGYRKQEDTVKEFAEKVVEVMNEHAVQHGYDPEGLPYYTVDIAVLQIEIEELAAEYGVEVEKI